MKQCVYRLRHAKKILSAALAVAVILSVKADASFPKANMQQYSPESTEDWVKAGCAKQCLDRLVIVSYSDREHGKAVAKAALNVANRLHEEGIPVAFVLAGDYDENPQDASMHPYINGQVAQGVRIEVDYGRITEGTISRLSSEESMYKAAKKAYRSKFSETKSSKPAYGKIKTADVTSASSEKYNYMIEQSPKKYPTFFVQGGTKSVFNAIVDGARTKLVSSKTPTIAVIKIDPHPEMEALETCISFTYLASETDALCTSILTEKVDGKEAADDQYLKLSNEAMSAAKNALSSIGL